MVTSKYDSQWATVMKEAVGSAFIPVPIDIDDVAIQKFHASKIFTGRGHGKTAAKTASSNLRKSKEVTIKDIQDAMAMVQSKGDTPTNLLIHPEDWNEILQSTQSQISQPISYSSTTGVQSLFGMDVIVNPRIDKGKVYVVDKNQPGYGAVPMVANYWKQTEEPKSEDVLNVDYVQL